MAARSIASNACKHVSAIAVARFGDLRKARPEYQTIKVVCIKTQRHVGPHRNGKRVWR